MSEPIEIPEDIEVLREVDVDGQYYLRTWETGRKFPTGQWIIGYEFTTHKREELGLGPLFAAEDCGVAPSQAVDSDDALLTLLSFLTLGLGDTDPEYFEDYTEDQLEWARSSEREALSLEVSLAEEDPDLATMLFAEYAPED